jgi:hypothetical protein
LDRIYFSSYFRQAQANDTNHKSLQFDAPINSGVKFTNFQEEVKTTDQSNIFPTMPIKKKLQLSCTVFIFDANNKKDHLFLLVKGLSKID